MSGLLLSYWSSFAVMFLAVKIQTYLGNLETKDSTGSEASKETATNYTF